MIDIKTLTDYVKQERDSLIGKILVKFESGKLFNLQAGVKGPTAVTILNTDVNFSDGTSCDWDDTGISELTERIIGAKPIKVDQSFCTATLKQTWLNYALKNPGQNHVELAFAEDFTNGVVDSNGAKLEKLVWQGDTASQDKNLNQIDGLVKIIEAAELAGTYEYAAGASAYETIMKVYSLMPSAVLSRKDAVIFCGKDMYRTFVQELIKQNSAAAFSVYQHMPEAEEDSEYVILPGTNVRVYGVAGLDNTGKVFGSYKDNFIYGTDLENDINEFRIVESTENPDKLLMRIRFVAGVQVAQPDMIVEAKEA